MVDQDILKGRSHQGGHSVPLAWMVDFSVMTLEERVALQVEASLLETSGLISSRLYLALSVLYNMSGDLVIISRSCIWYILIILNDNDLCIKETTCSLSG